MGCGSSVYKDPKIAGWRPQFLALGIDDRCPQLLYKVFRKCDLSHDGTISDTEVMMLLDMERTPFTERIFRVFDTDGSGKVDFREFVLACWNYCSMDMTFLPYFAFSLYDLDGGGEIGEPEIVQMLKDIYGKNLEENHIAQDLLKNQIPKYAGKTIDVNEFLGFIGRHDKLLFPVFQVVRKLQDGILGAKFWSKIVEDRKKFSHGKYMKFEDLLEKKFPKSDHPDHPLDKKKSKSATKSTGNSHKIHPTH
jgi:Ca2+-binding EF-hand superfamily protein